MSQFGLVNHESLISTEQELFSTIKAALHNCLNDFVRTSLFGSHMWLPLLSIGTSCRTPHSKLQDTFQIPGEIQVKKLLQIECFVVVFLLVSLNEHF